MKTANMRKKTCVKREFFKYLRKRIDRQALDMEKKIKRKMVEDFNYFTCVWLYQIANVRAKMFNC
jgi:hypothetical protein